MKEDQKEVAAIVEASKELEIKVDKLKKSPLVCAIEAALEMAEAMAKKSGDLNDKHCVARLKEALSWQLRKPRA